MGCVHTLGSTASAPGISPHGDGLALLLDVLEVCEGALELPSVDGLGSFARVFERHTKVAAAGARALCGLDLGCGVANLCAGKSVYALYHGRRIEGRKVRHLQQKAESLVARPDSIILPF